MDFVGKGQPLTRMGLTSALFRLGLGPNDAAYIWTVVEVETAGVTQGFGFRVERRPQILFERHKFRGFTNGRFNNEAPGISGPPGGYGTTASQYERLDRALSLCERESLGAEPALKSASWGMGQVMGFNHSLAGFSTAADMVSAMITGEDQQLAAMIGFLNGTNLDAALRNRDWARFARGYNGPNFAANQYDIKLEQQFERFSSGSLPDLEVRGAQAALFYLGFNPGRIDGILGPRTRKAIRSFRIAEGLPAGDELDGETYLLLYRRANIDP
jgi:hypothetical protein